MYRNLAYFALAKIFIMYLFRRMLRKEMARQQRELTMHSVKV